MLNNLMAQFPGWKIEPSLREELKDAMVGVFRDERDARDTESMKKSVDILLDMAAMDQKDAHLLAKIAAEQVNPTAKVVVTYEKPQRKDGDE